jgi:small subunit ribosomal protein S20
MATHLSTIKRARQDKKRRLRNRMMKSMVKTAEKKVRQSEDKDQATMHLRETSSLMDKAASKGILPRRTAARHKSRLARKVNTLSGQTGAAEKKTS